MEGPSLGVSAFEQADRERDEGETRHPPRPWPGAKPDLKAGPHQRRPFFLSWSRARTATAIPPGVSAMKKLAQGVGMRHQQQHRALCLDQHLLLNLDPGGTDGSDPGRANGRKAWPYVMLFVSVRPDRYRFQHHGGSSSTLLILQ